MTESNKLKMLWTFLAQALDVWTPLSTKLNFNKKKN